MCINIKIQQVNYIYKVTGGSKLEVKVNYTQQLNNKLWSAYLNSQHLCVTEGYSPTTTDRLFNIFGSKEDILRI